MRALLAGEGPDELGSWAREPAYRPVAAPDPEPGIVETLARRFDAPLEIAGAVRWKDIRKYRAGDHRGAETRNVLGAVLRAREAGCGVLIFTRDEDGHSHTDGDVQRGIDDAKRLFPEVAIVGGVARRTIDAWVLAFLGERSSEDQRDPKAELRKRHSIETRAQKVEAVSAAAIDGMPADAVTLLRWLDRARRHLSKSSG